jgi:hypothetical protein
MVFWKNDYGIHIRIFKFTLHITRNAIVLARSNLLLNGVNCSLIL